MQESTPVYWQVFSLCSNLCRKQHLNMSQSQLLLALWVLDSEFALSWKLRSLVRRHFHSSFSNQATLVLSLYVYTSRYRYTRTISKYVSDVWAMEHRNGFVYITVAIYIYIYELQCINMIYKYLSYIQNSDSSNSLSSLSSLSFPSKQFSAMFLCSSRLGYGRIWVLEVFYMTITALPTLESWCKTWNLTEAALVSNSSKFGAWPLRLSSHLVWASQEPGKLCCGNGDPPDTFTRGPSKMKSIVQQRGWHDYHDTDKNDYVASDDIPKD